MTALALPILGKVPTRYVIPSESTWARELLLSLHDSGAVQSEDLIGRPRTLSELLRNVLRRHWLEITRGERIFRWDLGVSREERHWAQGRDTATWLSITAPSNPDSDWPCPTYYLSEAMLHLESVAPGLGETVLATFYKALHHLPNTLTPQETYWQLQFCQWGGLESETEYAEEMGVMNDQSPEEVLADHDVYRRADFFQAMPEWAVTPHQRLTDAEVRRAACRDAFAAAVIEAVDRVMAVIWQRAPLADCSCRDADADAVSWIAWFRWSPSDDAPRLLDDWANQVMEGEFIEAATAICCSKDYTNAADWLARMRNTAQLARAIEPLVDLIAAPADATALPVQARVRV